MNYGDDDCHRRRMLLNHSSFAMMPVMLPSRSTYSMESFPGNLLGLWEVYRVKSLIKKFPVPQWYGKVLFCILWCSGDEHFFVWGGM